MPRYYFDSHDGEAFGDPDGVELAGFAAAKHEAFMILCQLAAGKEDHILDDRAFTVTISDEDRLVLMTLELAITLSPAMRRPL